MDREFLTADGGAAGKDNGLVFTLDFPDHVENGFVIKVGVVIVHPDGVSTVVVDHIRGDPLAEVRFEAVDTVVEQLFELFLIPLAGIGIGKVHKSQTGLPFVPLPYITVWLFQKISRRHCFLE